MKTSSMFYTLVALCLSVQYTIGIAVTGISAGVKAATGERPTRLNINELYLSGPSWDLFVLALREFQRTNQDDPLSYYQVAGVHGLPELPWDGVSRRGDPPGYCVHAAVTFPTWHRPYLALFEVMQHHPETLFAAHNTLTIIRATQQILWKHAQDIARTYPRRQREAYMAAALRLRMPFWDVLANPTLPQAASLPSVVVNTPNGTQLVENPLFNYTFHAEEGGNRLPAESPFARFPWTIRHFNFSSQQSNISDADAVLGHQYHTLLSLTFRLLASEADYTNMSCTTSSGNSVESIHNLVHNAVGGVGHMTDIAVSSFDPIFWLHHANVDRLFAMWQVINPQSYLVPTVNEVGTFAEPSGFMESEDSDLLPFHSDNGSKFWTSNTVRSTRTFGYTYPEILDWNTTQSSLTSNVRGSINKLYNPALVLPNTQPRVPVPPRNAELTGLQADTFHMASTVQQGVSSREWIITVEVERYAYSGPFVLDFFLEAPPESPLNWATASNLIGSHAQSIASNSASTHPNGSPGILSHGEVSATHCLSMRVQLGVLASVEPASVIPFLMKALNWRARDMSGCEVELESLAALSIAVGSQVVLPTRAWNHFPSYRELEIYANITAGKIGGAAQKQRPGHNCG